MIHNELSFEIQGEGKKLLGQRMFSYPITDDDGMPFPLITPAQMKEWGTAAQQSDQAVEGIKGLCPLSDVLPKLPWEAAIDLAHTLVSHFALRVAAWIITVIRVQVSGVIRVHWSF